MIQVVIPWKATLAGSILISRAPRRFANITLLAPWRTSPENARRRLDVPSGSAFYRRRGFLEHPLWQNVDRKPLL
jgi:hypothetical protein